MAFNRDYERRLLRQYNCNSVFSDSLEGNPFPVALPLSGGFPASSSVPSPVMATPARKVSGTDWST
jgi:hypothetical protein